jgi:hypothetical protein
MNMAIAIKSIPVLRAKAAEGFTVKAEQNRTAKHTVNFTKQATVAAKILAKSKV